LPKKVPIGGSANAGGLKKKPYKKIEERGGKFKRRNKGFHSWKEAANERSGYQTSEKERKNKKDSQKKKERRKPTGRKLCSEKAHGRDGVEMRGNI